MESVYKKVYKKKVYKKAQGLGSLVVECLPSRYETLGSISNATKIKEWSKWKKITLKRKIISFVNFTNLQALEKSLMESCLYWVGLWTYLWRIVLADVGKPSPWWAAPTRQGVFVLYKSGDKLSPSKKHTGGPCSLLLTVDGMWAAVSRSCHYDFLPWMDCNRNLWF